MKLMGLKSDVVSVACAVAVFSTAQADTIYVDDVSCSDCCSVHGTPGCDDPSCEAVVCDAFPPCCDVEWDAACVIVATVLCDPLCTTPNGTETFPFCSIQAGIDNAVDTDEVVVAPGTYFETIDFLGKAIWLHSSDGADVTTIDGTGFFHVVQCVSGEGPDTMLDGFTITGGNANGFALDSFGGGMFNFQSSPTVTDCTFVGNDASSGGGMATRSSSPTVTNCTFTGNSATSFGGGMFNFQSSPTVTNCEFTGNLADSGGGMANSVSSPTVTNCTLSANSAIVLGGGMSNNSSNPMVTNCSFIGNTAGFNGAGMYNTANSSPTVTDCTFSGNMAANVGGGMFNTGPSNPTVTDCTFAGNSAGAGGAMATWFGSSPTIENCQFINNEVTGFGGALDCFNLSNPVMTDCLFSGNDSQFRGGGATVSAGSAPVFTNCSFSDNTAGDVGGGMYVVNDASPVLTGCTLSGNTSVLGGALANLNSSSSALANCVLWGNSRDQIFDDFDSVTTVQYSDVESGFPGIGNIDADPLFVDPDNGDYRLSPGSPCIDAGDNTAVPKGVLRDLDGNPRFVADVCAGAGGATVDMGAYEFQGTSCDLSNILTLLAAWGSCRDCHTCPADFDGDCSVGILDLLILLGNWG